MRRPFMPVVLGLMFVLPVVNSGAAAQTSRGGDLRVNQLQVIGTHNSYHREVSEPEQAAYDAAINTPGDYDASLAYSHAALPRQVARQNVRGLELDLLGDPLGGLYGEPLIRTTPIGLGAHRGSRCCTSPTWTTRRRACSL